MTAPKNRLEKDSNKSELDFEAMQKRCNRRRFRDLRNTHALVDFRHDYLKACWIWLYGEE